MLPPTRTKAQVKAASRRGLLIALAAILAVIALLATYVFYSSWQSKRAYEGRVVDDLSMYGDNFDTTAYDLQNPRLDVAGDYAFETKVDTGRTKVEDYRGVTDDGVVTAVFTDPSLTTRYPVQVRVHGDDITSQPASGVMCNQYMDPDTKKLHVGEFGGKGSDDNCNTAGDYFNDHYGRWWGHGTYYFVEYYGEDGTRLTRPKVTYFTVRDDTHTLATPQNITPSIDGQGLVKVNWDAVPDATHYKVYLQRGGAASDKDASEREQEQGDKAAFADLYLLASVEANEVNLGAWDPSNDKDHIDEVASFRFTPDGDSNPPIYQNMQFVSPYYWDSGFDSEDQFMGASFDESRQGQYQRFIDNTSLVVVAFGDDEARDNSQVGAVNVNALLSQVPVQPAYYTEQHYAPKGAAFVSYMTMADGMTRKMPNEFLWDTLKQQQGDTFTVDYLTTGTRLTGTTTISGYGDTPEQVKEKVTQVRADMEKSDVQTGLMKDLYSSETVNWDGLNNPVSDADLDKANGTTEYVKFVAANLLEDRTYMEVTKYASQAGAPTADDVVEEAVHQNPLILHALPHAYTKTDGDRTYLYVRYFDDPWGEERTTQLRQQLDQRAGQIVGEIVKDGMDDRAKATAINQYLVDHLTYDYDALNEVKSDGTVDRDYFTRHPSNQVASALLGNVDGKDLSLTVCAGYASSFKMLADKAGLPAIWVSGVVSTGSTGGNHAWNKVKVDGQWLVVDSTWNDTGDSVKPTEYLLLPESDPLLQRRGQVYDADAVLDSKLAEYGLVS